MNLGLFYASLDVFEMRPSFLQIASTVKTYLIPALSDKKVVILAISIDSVLITRPLIVSIGSRNAPVPCLKFRKIFVKLVKMVTLINSILERWSAVNLSVIEETLHVVDNAYGKPISLLLVQAASRMPLSVLMA